LPRLDALCWLGLDEKASWAWTELCFCCWFVWNQLSGVGGGGGFFGRGPLVGWPRPAVPQQPHIRSPPRPPRGGPVPPSERRPSSNQSSNRHERMGTEYWATYSGLMENRRSPECCTRPVTSNSEASPQPVSKAGKAMAHEARRPHACLILAFSQAASGKWVCKLATCLPAPRPPTRLSRYFCKFCSTRLLGLPAMYCANEPLGARLLASTAVARPLSLGVGP
jgi:hypothetical protein